MTDDVLIVHGGTPLQGQIRVRGAKNLVSKAMVAALLGESPSRLYDVPRIRDVEVVSGLLELHGVKVSAGAEDGELVMDPTNVESASTDEINVHAGSSRIPILLCGPLLHRLGHAFIPDLGGCHIGPRPIDFHIQALREFGAVVDKTPEGMHLSAPNGLHGAKLELPYPSVGATEQVLLTAVRAEGVTELRNAAIEPEIIDLICILQKMGAIITVHTDRVIEIQGVPRLYGYEHKPIPDRIEAASWAAAALATRGEIEVVGARQADMMTFLNVFRNIGGELKITDDRVAREGVSGAEGGIKFWHPGGELKAVALETDVHPGFMTDWQQPLVVALTQARGISIMHETVYEQRLGYTDALNSMGATIQVYRDCLGGTPCRFGRRNFMHSAVIAGPSKLHAADLVIPDLRAGFAHLIAALAAEGTSRVYGVNLIKRGYEDFEAKLSALGAHVERP
ncbi:UDP-N-acetylglucosamine 1-carboxyvinyltransferase [Actinoplanes utahensis]|uniref:UDP-N-acetylglucosamine 1-carboxyvinyltransferase n=1 Tax=Actinoplanes utahensis TaxID=1869 RepID=A0A0A6UKG4_ACTUT|nr:UDP-N-acetylglucosamine 1-carboxyvinyltransferase [Actinoplanes utahensis]KHD76615.1 UDP-N-acetylglucosamine 1-carboxyvinyltransferase [Actinoplanes utahensis]GIF31313.1 UDP-N-acetylglucosamine 1-carboxyvinyltransferase [Actinoplanes utahensis]